MDTYLIKSRVMTLERALVLSGGSERGAFEVGAVDYLVNQDGFDFNYFFGTSIGALNVSILGQARDHEELKFRIQQLKKLWLSIRGYQSIYRKNPLGMLNLLSGRALYEPVGLRRILRQNIDLDRLFDPTNVVNVTTVALETGELFYADTRSPEIRQNFLNYVLASASIPFYFPAVQIDSKHWYDGGLRDITPLGAVFDEEPDEITVITTYPIGPDLEPILPQVAYRGPFKNLSQMIAITMNAIAAKDIQLANAINQDNRTFPGRKKIPLRIIAPEQALSQKSPTFHPAAIRKYMELGYNAARKPLLLSTDGRCRYYRM
jgi:predicted acylesterase/phospholipase RssA